MRFLSAKAMVRPYAGTAAEAAAAWAHHVRPSARADRLIRVAEVANWLVIPCLQADGRY